jgi:hypothetical protein
MHHSFLKEKEVDKNMAQPTIRKSLATTAGLPKYYG